MKQQTENDTRDQIKTNTSISDAIEKLLARIKESLQEEIEREVLEIIASSDGVMIRVREADSFPSGSALLQPGFMPVLDKLQSLLDESEGRIIVAGHTDNVPISSSIYPSNWVLSAARAASVVHYLSEIRLTDPSRIEIRAFSDTQPVALNDTPENRAKNRRIEINISAPEEDN